MAFKMRSDCKSKKKSTVRQTNQVHHGRKRRKRRTRTRPRLQHILLLPWLFGFVYVFPDVWGLRHRDVISDVTPDSGFHEHIPGRVLLSTSKSVEADMAVSLGYSLGILSAVFDLTATFPDVLKVLQEKTFYKLDIVYFLFCILGNCLYVTAVFTQEVSINLIWHTLPWTVARLGLIGIQLGIMVQIYLNRKTQRGKELEDEVVSLLRNDYPNIEEELRCLTANDDYKPKRNRYLAKMRNIGRQIDKTSGMESSDSLAGSDSIQVPNPLFRASCIRELEGSSSSGDSINELLTPVSSEIEESMHLEIWNENLTEDQIFSILSAEDEQRFSPPKSTESLLEPIADIRNPAEHAEHLDPPPELPDLESRPRVHTAPGATNGTEYFSPGLMAVSRDSDPDGPVTDIRRSSPSTAGLQAPEVEQETDDGEVTHLLTSLPGEDHWWTPQNGVVKDK